MTDIILLDGGMGQELVHRSKDPAQPQWSLFVMQHEPELVQELHEEYLRSGATVLTLNTYATTRGRFRKFGDESHFIPMQNKAMDLAEAARDAVGVEASIAGCLPPLAGSYRPENVWGHDEMMIEYREIVELEAPRVDLFLCETMSTAAEGRAAAMAACESGKPVWVAWTLAETPAEDGTARLRSGETVSDAIAGIEGLPVAGILLNCCPPEMMSLAMNDMAADGRPFGGYANAFTPIPDEYKPGTTVDMLGKRNDLGPDVYAQHTMDWVGTGATIVGGCCEVGPAHTAAMAEALKDAGHRLVAA